MEKLWSKVIIILLSILGRKTENEKKNPVEENKAEDLDINQEIQSAKSDDDK